MKYRRNTKRIVLGFLALALLVGFVIVASFRFAEASRERRRYEMEKAELRVPEPNIATAEVRDLRRVRRFTADLRPWMDADVPAEVSGRVTEVLVESGAQVKKGDPLVRLDETLARIAVEQARSRFEESVRLRKEAERLFASRAISETAYHAQISAVRINQSALDEAVERLARHTIRAPFDGVVERRFVDVGEAVNPNQPVARIVDLSKLRVEFFVTESDLSAFSVGQPVEVKLETKGGLVLEPIVNFISPSADARTRLFRIEAILPNRDALPGGLQGVLQAETQPFAGIPSLPAAAVQFSGRRAIVWKFEAEEAVPVEVRVGPELDGFFPVLEGLQPGDRVLIR